MELMEVILTKENLNRAYKKVVANKGASGIDEIMLFSTLNDPSFCTLFYCDFMKLQTISQIILYQFSRLFYAKNPSLKLIG